MLGSNVLQSLNGSANAFWVSHVLGESALAAVANANNVLFLLLGVVFGVSASANVMTSQAMGAGNLGFVKRIVGSSTTFFIVLSLLVGVLGYFFTPAILAAMKTPGEARVQAEAYLRVIFMAITVMYFFNYLMSSMRGAGNSRTPFYFSLLAVGLDITLNPCLMMGLGPFPKLGIAGSAMATLTSQSISLVGILIYLYRTRSALVLYPGEGKFLKPEIEILKTLVLKGLPMGVQMLVYSGSAIVMIGFVNGYGAHTAAAYGAGLQLWNYLQMPAMAMTMAVSYMAAQNVGAGRDDRLSQIANVGMGIGTAMTAVPVAAMYLLEPYLFRVFLPDGSVTLPIARHMDHIVAWGFMPYGVTFVLAGLIRAKGAVWPQLITMFVAGWIVRIPVAWALTPALGVDAVWWSFPAANFAAAALMYGYYRWGGWRKVRLLEALERKPA